MSPGRRAGARLSLPGLVRLGLVVSLCLVPGVAGAGPAKDVNEQFQSWTSLNSTTRVTDRLGTIADVHVRRNDFLADPSFYLLRFGAHCWVSNAFQATLGYAHLWQAPACERCETWAGENRVYQQLQHVTRIGRTTVLHRLRNEQRWKDMVVNDVRTGKTTFSNRVRYLVSVTVSVSKNPKVPALVLADEVALQFGRRVDTFDQNRVFLGLKHGLGASWSLDLGYLLVVQQKAAGYDLDHTVRCFFYFTPDLKKAKSSHHPATAEE
jgi:hypothetical protein